MSLCYGYVNFYNAIDAERAMDVLAFQPVLGQAIRIMWSQSKGNTGSSALTGGLVRQPISGSADALLPPDANLFINNLNEAVTSRQLNDAFSQYGNVVSCKVLTAPDASATPLGRGFVQFSDVMSAKAAIEGLHGTELFGQTISVKVFVKGGRKGNASENADDSHGTEQQRNLFVKNLPRSFSKQQLRDLFKAYGSITSTVVMLNEDGTSKGFGFVEFESQEIAAAAMTALDKTEVEGGRTIGVSFARKSGDPIPPRPIKLLVRQIHPWVTPQLLRDTLALESFGSVRDVRVEKRRAPSADDSGSERNLQGGNISEAEQASSSVNRISVSAFDSKTPNSATGVVEYQVQTDAANAAEALNGLSGEKVAELAGDAELECFFVRNPANRNQGGGRSSGGGRQRSGERGNGRRGRTGGRASGNRRGARGEGNGGARGSSSGHQQPVVIDDSSYPALS